MVKKWKCLICKEEVDDDEPCKCMKMKMGYEYKGSGAYQKAKEALKRLRIRN